MQQDIHYHSAPLHLYHSLQTCVLVFLIVRILITHQPDWWLSPTTGWRLNELGSHHSAGAGELRSAIFRNFPQFRNFPRKFPQFSAIFLTSQFSDCLPTLVKNNETFFFYYAMYSLMFQGHQTLTYLGW